MRSALAAPLLLSLLASPAGLAHEGTRAGLWPLFDDGVLVGGATTWGLVLRDEERWLQACEAAYPASVTFVHLVTAGTLLVGTQRGLYLAEEGGCDFRPLEGPGMDESVLVGVVPRDAPRTLLLLTRSSAGDARVLRSDDGGASFAATGATPEGVRLSSLVAGPDGTELWAGGWRPSPGGPALLRSLDGGLSWTELDGTPWEGYLAVAALGIDGDGTSCVLSGLTPDGQSHLLRVSAALDEITEVGVFPGEVTSFVATAEARLVIVNKSSLHRQDLTLAGAAFVPVEVGPTRCLLQLPMSPYLWGCGSEGDGAYFYSSSDGALWQPLVSFDVVEARACSAGTPGGDRCQEHLVPADDGGAAKPPLDEDADAPACSCAQPSADATPAGRVLCAGLLLGLAGLLATRRPRQASRGDRGSSMPLLGLAATALLLLVGGCAAPVEGSAQGPEPAASSQPYGLAPVEDGEPAAFLTEPCSRDGWCRLSPALDTRAATSVYASSTSGLWIAGEQGALLRVEGEETTTALLAADTHIEAMSGTGAGDVWVVGLDSEVLRYDGETLKVVAARTDVWSYLLFDVWVAEPEDVWAVGSDENGYGVLLRYHDGDWRAYESPTPSWLTGVFGSAPDDVWAVGEAGVILHWDGARWQKVPSDSAAWLSDVWAYDADEAWIVGAGGTVLRYDGERWRAVDSGTTRFLHAVFGVADDVWAVGDAGTALHFDGASWTDLSIAAERALRDVQVTDTGEVWVVGDEGAVLRKARADEPWASPFVDWAVDLEAVFGAAHDDAWAVGAGGLALHWGGDAWTVVDTGASNALNGVFSLPDGAAWAVGEGGTVLRYANTGWSSVSAPSSATLLDVWSDGTDVWAVGDAATLLRWRDGELPAPVSVDEAVLPPGTRLEAVWGASGDDVWMVGGRGTILHWDGSSMARVDAGVSTALLDVGGAASDHVWVVGAAGVALHFDGAGWEQTATGTTAPLASVAVVGEGRVLAAGRNGLLLEWEGSWRAVDSGTRADLRAVWAATGAAAAWAVGSRGAVVREVP